MARVLGTSTPTPGTGTKTINIGIAATWARIMVSGKSGDDSYYHFSEGIYDGGSQYVIPTTSTFGGEPISGKVIRLRDSSNFIIFEASVSVSGTSLVFNVTTAPANLTPILIWAGN